MIAHIGLENGFESRSVAWLLDQPGCYAYGEDGSSAIVQMGQAVPAYIQWLSNHTPEPWYTPENIDIRLEEVWDDYYLDANYARTAQAEGTTRVQAWFLDDWRPLSVTDVKHGLLVLEWGRREFLAAVEEFTVSELDAPHPGEHWSVRGIMAHVATTNWWLLDRLNLAGVERSQLPKDIDERFQLTYNRLVSVLPDLAGKETVIGKSGELWSARKLLRRAAWHLRDHTEHVQKLRKISS
jgi:hypothetical protein